MQVLIGKFKLILVEYLEFKQLYWVQIIHKQRSPIEWDGPNNFTATTKIGQAPDTCGF